METVLEFAATDLKAIVEHSVAAKAWQAAYESQATDDGPLITLVGDDGVYILSAGVPAQMNPNAGENGPTRLVAYARGCNPYRDGRMAAYDNKVALYGGDDGADSLPWAGDILRMIEAGAETIVITLKESSIGLGCIMPTRKGAQ